MSQKMMKKSKGLIAALLGTMMIAALTIWGCGTSSYDHPAASATTTKTATALIDAATLQSWITEGKVNAPFGSVDRVVILDVTATPKTPVTVPATPAYTVADNPYNKVGHIPGAYLIPEGNAYFQATREEGPLKTTGSLVCTGDTMDSLIQNAGIDKNTTIVVTSSGSIVDLARTYATLRYWGFPKTRIKVLNGGNAAWPVADLTKKASNIVKSTYGVAQNGKTNINTDMRTSLVEMIAYVRGIDAGNTNKVTIVDTVRGTTTVVNAKVSSTTDLIDGTKYTPFDGAMTGSYSYHATRMVTSGLYFKDAATIKADLSAAFGTDGMTALGDADRDATRTFVSLCRAGNYASVGYFALDGIAYYNSNVDVKWYDGSLGQFNMMASLDQTATDAAGVVVNGGGKLAVNSDWNTTSYMKNLTWNNARGQAVVDYTTRVLGIEPSFAEGNQLETADKAYRSAVSGTSGGAAGGGGGGC